MSEQELAPTGDGDNERAAASGTSRTTSGAAGSPCASTTCTSSRPSGAALPLGVLSAVGMGTVVYANETATAMLGRPGERAAGPRMGVGDPPSDRPELVAAIAVVLDTAARQRVVLRTGGGPRAVAGGHPRLPRSPRPADRVDRHASTTCPSGCASRRASPTRPPTTR